MTTTTSPIEQPQITETGSRMVGWMLAHKWAVAMIVALLAGALAVRLLTFDRYLPFLDHSDESYMFLLARAWRGYPDEFITQRLAGYPPLYLWLFGGVSSLFEQYSGRPWFMPIDYVYIMRQIALAAGVATTALLLFAGWQLAGVLGGLFAGALWSFAPFVVDNNSMAVADPLGYLFCAAAVAFAIRAWQRDSFRWLFGALIASVLCIYTKYWTLYPLLLWGIVVIKLLRAKGRAALLPLGLQVIFGLAAAGGLLLYLGQSGLSQISPEMSSFTEGGAGNLLDWWRHLNNLSYFPRPIGTELFAGLMAAGLGAWLVSRRMGWRVVDWRWAIFLAVTAVAAVLPISSFIYISSMKYVRHALPVTILLIVLCGMSFAQIVWTLSRVAEMRRLPRVLPALAAGLLMLAVFVPYALGNAELVTLYARTPIQVALWRYTDANLPADGLILVERKSRIADTWNRDWSGYDGGKTFEWWVEEADLIVGSTPESYIERGITYFAMSEADRARYEELGLDIDAFLNQLTLIKTIEPTGELFDPAVAIYRINPPENSADYVFSEQIRLTGYDLNTTQPTAGSELVFRPYWQATRRPDTNYSMFIHLYPAETDDLKAQADGAPGIAERPTLTWDDPDELLMGTAHTLALPGDLAAGQYRMVVGLYDYSTGIRLTGDDGASYFSIPIEVEN